MTGAKLEGADVEGADFRGASLGGAAVDGASLAKANLELAELPAAKARRVGGGAEARGTPSSWSSLAAIPTSLGAGSAGALEPRKAIGRGSRPRCSRQRDRSECQGVKRLPAAMREALERSPTESVPLPEWEDPNHG